jgi:hypothetical protein
MRAHRKPKSTRPDVSRRPSTGFSQDLPSPQRQLSHHRRETFHVLSSFHLPIGAGRQARVVAFVQRLDGAVRAGEREFQIKVAERPGHCRSRASASRLASVWTKPRRVHVGYLTRTLKLT